MDQAIAKGKGCCGGHAVANMLAWARPTHSKTDVAWIGMTQL